jgi:hypothetical protein
MRKTWEQAVEDVYRKSFQGILPIYNIKISDSLYTPLNAPTVWAINQTASEMLDRICDINGTRWRFDEEGTFIYEDDTLGDSIAVIQDDDIETLDYEFSTFDYLNWVEARGGEKNDIVQTAAYPDSVASDGIRYELVEDSGFKGKSEALRKAKATLYGSLSDVESGNLTTVFPRLDIKPRSVITIDSTASGVIRIFYVSEVSKSFDIANREIETSFVLKSKEVELLTNISEIYDNGVL